MTSAHILVLGAGPAGAAVALGLNRLGYRVSVVSEWRRFDAVEGVSQRVLDGLRHAGLQQAADSAAAPSAREVYWNGTRQTLNTEFLLDRRAFDHALRQDLQAAGIRVTEAKVRTLASDAQGHQVQLDGPDGASVIAADFLVEARGRLAPLSGKGLRGPETLGLLSTWQGIPGSHGSAVESLEDGWAWMARLADGRCYWQLTLDVASAELPGKDRLAEFCAARRTSALVRDFFGESARQEAAVHARTSTATLCLETSDANWLRVGDAAMAVDPLSGNGIFQSLSSALQAPAVIHTLLTRPDRVQLAQRFHQRRIEHLFHRFARIGRDFYAMEQRWAERPFWQARRAWPDQQPIHVVSGFEQLRIEKAPVINGDVIDEADVVVSPDQPLGVWHLQGVELAPIVAALQQDHRDEALKTLAPEQRHMVQGWLAAQGYRPA
ncbi:MAG TPA: FAD-dependent monooxygenase [Pseudogulbenkiania sp.]|nr:FAD-dependent monooxygenase [Pseudogulbenkiania sp.]